ncbi:MAG: DUF3800 domain-containing protein [Candidatus Paceibacterota bacterium]|jgi:hypothetical protein
MKEYSIYCDESSINNNENQFMTIGCVFVNRKIKNEIKNEINKIKKKHSYHRELKWSKTTDKLLPVYKEIIDYFYSIKEDDFRFCCIEVDKEKVKYKEYHDGDEELAFYKFYYELLKNKFEDNATYKIFLDFKPNKNKYRIKFLNLYWEKRILYYKNSTIKNVSSLESSKNSIMQIADLFTGAVGHAINFYQKETGNLAKKELINYIAQKNGKTDLLYGSPLSDLKFNIFKINLF